MSAPPCPPAGEPAPAAPAEALRDEVSQLHEAVRSQRDIGMAIGLVSASYHCSTEQAWRTLLRVSQDSNTKVRTVAAVLVATHDGTADADDVAALGRLTDHLPASGWPASARTGEDPAP
ncbi:ANTAR domain-containing protein [Nocardioides sp. zg-1308]|uniref:ANTAR domain-containing protein n=1 Tax=Nocardioides TaxID=1839 RepID=UPI001555A140|nr:MULTISPECIES: ANTAR domain-containing protein [unclassified Nocardioides]NPD04902.1 ANTAR domain-containing protein [Nocardioides sp. zg-1308]WQQ22795.1 ANTAR domain-containing protein [Nocardioides sp. S-34]